jgi:predicted DNA binding CopG/RHH family protein
MISTFIEEIQETVSFSSRVISSNIHSIADYWDELEEGRDIFKRPKLTPVTLKFDPPVLKKVKMFARKRGISYNSYIRYLIAKSVEKEMLPASR